ncbi:membrane protein [Leuconostoc mesenteroides P45]|uniref:DUF1304 domain-containing protein n=1 Tax=Leuconostoc mesenteroides TaxID=1245 RepID=UPI000503EB8B|nr:DUF1304 domain-containing protein [Leuconostoc mesenteroides]KGB50756.1 membrane protein [Leuconostoc mesenteroides P45]
MFAYIMVTLVSLEAIGIMFVEMFGTTSQQAKAFDLKESFVQIPEVKTLLANQGIYNGLFGALIIGTMLFVSSGPQQVLMLQMEMLFIFLAAVYGALTAAKKIILVQGLPAFIAIILLFLK